MRVKKVLSKIWLSFLLLSLTYVAGVTASAAEEQAAGEISTVKEDLESMGMFYGEYKDCAYTYINGGKEVQIVDVLKEEGDVKIPDTIDGKKVTTIDWNFYVSHKNLRSITLSKNIKKLGDNFIYYRKYSKILVKEYRVVGSNPKFKAKGGVIFSKKGKTLVTFPVNKKKSVYRIPKGVKKIGAYAFSYADKLSKVVMPDSVTEIGKGAFLFANVKGIDLSNKLKKVGEGAFRETHISELIIPSNLKKIPHDMCSYNSKLKKVVIRQGVKEIGAGAFLICRSLRKIEIPPSVKKMDESAFMWYTDGSEKINLTIYAKKGSTAYKCAKNWKHYGIKVKAI